MIKHIAGKSEYAWDDITLQVLHVHELGNSFSDTLPANPLPFVVTETISISRGINAFYRLDVDTGHEPATPSTRVEIVGECHHLRQGRDGIHRPRHADTKSRSSIRGRQ